MSRNPRNRRVQKRHTPREREKVLSAYHRSQQTQADFVARHGIGLSTLSKWLREERQAPNPVQVSPVLQEVVMPSLVKSGVSEVEIIHPQGWTMRLSGNLASETVQRWLKALPC
jgi:transposase-like protein